jgi:MFS family permease
MTTNPLLLVALQVLDGIGAACFGIMVPLIVSDVAGRSKHFNLSLGAVGFAIGIGSTLSTPAAGWLSDHLGSRFAFYCLTAIALSAVLVAAFAMPETRPSKDDEQGVQGAKAGDAAKSEEVFRPAEVAKLRARSAVQ